ncbi:MAG: hypothetical protein Q7J06_08850 [Bacteroidales bacterium]|nr:hypothetical protein [Bacteroidales bacterium]
MFYGDKISIKAILVSLCVTAPYCSAPACAYVRGYQEVPESAEEIEAVHRLGIAVLAGEPWE